MSFAKSNRRPVTSMISMPRACASTIASRFAAGNSWRLSSSVPSMSMAIKRIGIHQLYRAPRPPGYLLLRGVLNFSAYDQTTTDHHHSSGMFPLQEDLSAHSTEKSLRLRRPAPGALRSEGREEDFDTRSPALSARNYVALRRSAALARTGHAWRRHDAGASREARRRIHGPAQSLY